MKIFYFSAIISFVLAFYFESTMERRAPSSLASEKVEFLKLKLNERVELIVLGIEDSTNKGNLVDLNEIKNNVIFKTTDSMVPKFMFSLVDGEVKEIYSFELKRKSTKMNEAQESYDRPRWYVEIDFDDKFLPKKLLDMDSVRRDSVMMSTLKLAHTGILFTEYALIGIVLNRIIKTYEDIKSYQASYLERLIRLELFENKVPILSEVFTEEDLWKMGAGLNLRYHQVSDLAPFFTEKNKMVDLYKKFRKLKEQDYFITMSKLVERSNQEGLLTIPLSSDFAIVYGFKDKSYYEEFSNFLIAVEDPTRMINVLEDHELNDEGLIPLGIFSTRQSSSPMTVVDFNNIGKNTKKNSLVNIVEVAKEIGFDFLSFSGLSIALKTIDGAVTFVNQKTGKTIFEHRIYSDAEFDLLVDTGFLEISSHEILKGALDKQLEKIDMSYQERSEIINNLQSDDKKLQEDTVTRVVKKFSEEEREAKIIDFGDNYEKAGYRLKNWYAFKAYISDDKKTKRFIKKLEKREVNKPRAPASQEAKFDQPVVMLLIDGLRPDRFRQAAKDGLIPNLKKYFIDEGHEFNSYTTRSLTLPSWGTIFTGHTPDQHGVRSNTPISRTKIQPRSNYTDIRKDLVSIYETGNNRSLEHLKESGVKWLGDYYAEAETITNYMPYSRGLNLPFTQIGEIALDKIDEITFGSLGGALALDIASVERAIDQIKDEPGKHKLIMNWFASVDSASHHNNESLDEIYKEIDNSFEKLVRVLQADPVLRDAHIFLVSDHGMRGGHEHKGTDLNLFPYDVFMKNTSFNLTTFFTGDYFLNRDYEFVVKTFESPTPKHDLYFLKEFQIHPFDYIYRGKSNNQGEPNVLLDTSGDALAQIYLKSPTNEWEERPSFYDLENYPLNGHKYNLIKDLMDFKLLSVVLNDPRLRLDLFQRTGFKPVEYFATWLKDKNRVKELSHKMNIREELSREPIIIMNEESGAIIFSKKAGGIELFRYIPFKSFSQTANGDYLINHGQLSRDILGYGNVETFRYKNWYSERELLHLFKDHQYPNAITSLTKLLTLDSSIQGNSNRQDERPDFVLLARPGFNFNSSYSTEGDHGAIERAQVKHSVFLTKLGDKDSFEYKDSTTPVMAKDILPTVLKINRVKPDSKLWKPFWHTLFK